MQHINDLIRLFDDTVNRIGSSHVPLDYMAYPNHLIEIAPIFEIDPEKELEILAHKYRLQVANSSGQLQSTTKVTSSGPINLSNYSVNNARGQSLQTNTSLQHSKLSIFEPQSTLSTQRRKIKITRWLTQQVGEYDVTNDFWKFQAAEISSLFNAFSSLVALPSHDLMVIGGLDDSIPNRPSFTNHCFLIQEVPEDAYTNRYVEKHLPSMITRRGCMSSVYHEGYIYSFGGINYTDKVMRKCERFNLFDENPKWQKIADMKQCRKNASAVSVTADTLYVFGGSSNS